MSAPIEISGPVAGGPLNIVVYDSVVFRDTYESGYDLGNLHVHPGATLEFGAGLSRVEDDGEWFVRVIQGGVYVGGPVTGIMRMWGELSGTAWFGSVVGDVTLGTGMPSTGAVFVSDDISGTLRFAPHPSFGTFVCGLVSPGSITGTLQIGNAATAVPLEGQLWVRNGVQGGTIKVYGDVKPHDGNSPSAYIRIDGGFGPDGAEPSMIGIDGVFEGEDRFITIDFDGYHEDDRWDPNSRIWIGANDPYTGNNPDVRLYEITGYKGDLDNNEAVTYYNIDPLILAFDPEAYAAAYAGIAGARVFHGDLNCDSVVDFYDIDPFVARIGQPCSDACGGGDNMQGGGEGQPMQVMGGGAAVIAAQLAASVSAENMPALLVAIEQLALNPPANSTVDWSAVLAALAGI